LGGGGEKSADLRVFSRRRKKGHEERGGYYWVCRTEKRGGAKEKKKKLSMPIKGSEKKSNAEGHRPRPKAAVGWEVTSKKTNT